MIPGIQDFYDGMHSAVAAEMAHAIESHGHLEAPSLAELAGAAFHVLGPGGEFDGLFADHTHDTALHVGSPNGDGFTHQTTAFTCAVVSQKMILDQFHITDPRSGEPVTEKGLMYDGVAHGWLDEHGTSIGNMGRYLEYYGLPCHHGSDWGHLVQDLADGHQAVIAVNAHELWSDFSIFGQLSHILGNAPNHALVLKGLKLDEQGHVVVVVNDPGRPDGSGVEYPLEHFQAALDCHGFHYVATDIAPAGWTAESEVLSHVHSSVASLIPDIANTGQWEQIGTFAATLTEMGDKGKHELFRNI